MMAIPQNIINEFAFIQGQIDQSVPLSTAPQPTIVALQLNAALLVNDCQNAQLTLAVALDTWTPPPSNDPAIITTGVLGLAQNAGDEANVVLLRGLAGRMVSNLNQL